MRTLGEAYAAVRRKNIDSYKLLALCTFISILLITSFAIIMQSDTVQTMLPEGGDSRKQMTMIFVLAIVGCGAFTTYASALFFRSKSREVGIYMALGTKKSKIFTLLFKDISLITLCSGTVGILLGAPLAAFIWQIFGMLVKNNEDMAFRLNMTGFLWPLAFWVFTFMLLAFMGWLFTRRSNIIDVVNDQRKSEAIRDVKGWYGIVGLLFLVLGAAGAVAIPSIFASFGFTPPFWINLLYLVSAIGLYLMLIFVVIRGFGNKRSYYKNIISRSTMRFQGRQTVLNMCVIAMLTMAAYFSLFYIPMQLTTALVSYANRPVDYAFHHRIDELSIPDRESIMQMAAQYEINVHDYTEVPFVNLATDGYDREWTDDGRFGNEYHTFYAEEQFLSESGFRMITGTDIHVLPGQYIFVTTAEYNHSPYDYIEDMRIFTNPDTMQTLPVSFGGEAHYDMLNRFIVLNDKDYADITDGLGAEWKETWVQFNVDNSAETYAFAKHLKNVIIDCSTEKSAMYENYDRIERMTALASGVAYRGDVDPDLQVNYAARESSQFNQYWRYVPMFRVIDQQDFFMNFAVFLLLFVFMAIICMAAVIVISYTRCLTIALSNQQLYRDLRRLGAKQAYLYKEMKIQISKVFFVPAAIGTTGMFAFFIFMMYANSGGFETGELLAFAINTVLVVVISLILWCIYRLTLRKISRMLGLTVK